MGKRDLSILICTANRPASLRETLDGLVRCDRNGIGVEVLVVDNAGSAATRSVVESFRERIPIRYLTESKPGKGHALNRALAESPWGDIIAVLDDDMSPEPNWIQGVLAISARWPQCDFFTGRSYVIWPDQPIPDWALAPEIRGWAFSVLDYRGERDRSIEPGQWPSGNHFWFRPKLLRSGRRFEPVWATEPRFIMEAVEAGARGIIGPDAVAGHRIQPELLDEQVLRDRAIRVGRSFAAVRLPCRWKVKQGILLNRHPFLFRGCCILQLGHWGIHWILSRLIPGGNRRFILEITALERLATFLELLRLATPIRHHWKQVDRKRAMI